MTNVVMPACSSRKRVLSSLFLLQSFILSISSSVTSKFLWLSDIHLDPFYGQTKASTDMSQTCSLASTNDSYPYGIFGCDAPLSLFQETLKHSSDLHHDLDFILFTGDLCRHSNDLFDDPISTTKSILSTVINMTHSMFPNVPIVAAIGNNDFTPDYYLDLEDQNHTNNMLNMVTDAFASIFETSNEESQFRKGGYFARNITDRLTILVLNTIMYSRSHLPAEQTYLEDPLGQFAWLQDQLQIVASSNRRVYIASHIPPALGSFRKAQLWHDKYLETYYDIINSTLDDGILAGQLFGHLHTDEFRFISHTNGYSYPLFISPSVTPVYGSNPSYRVVQYDDETADLVDYETFYIDITNTTSIQEDPSWIEGTSFRESFGVSDMSKESLKEIISKLEEESARSNSTNAMHLWNAFLSRREVYSSRGGDDDSEIKRCLNDDKCRSEWLCVMTALTRKEYETCLVKRVPTQDSVFFAGIIAATLVVVLLFLFCFAGKHRFASCLKRRMYQSNLQDVEINGELDIVDNSLPEVT